MDELFEFLKDPKRDVRKIAIQNIAAYSGSNEHVALIKSRAAPYLARVCPLLSDEQSIAQDAVITLINLSAADSEMTRLMIESDVVGLLMNHMTSRQLPLKMFELCFLLLSNVTKDHLGVRKLLCMSDSSNAIALSDSVTSNTTSAVSNGCDSKHVRFLMAHFLRNDPTNEEGQNESEYSRWVSNVFTNVTQIYEGRELFLRQENDSQNQPRPSLLSQIVRFLESSDPIRRGGTVGVIRNCLFEYRNFGEMLDKISLFPQLMKALEKNNESVGIQRMLAECLLILSVSNSLANVDDATIIDLTERLERITGQVQDVPDTPTAAKTTTIVDSKSLDTLSKVIDRLHSVMDRKLVAKGEIPVNKMVVFE